MPTLLCQRTPADQVDYAAERFIVCKWIGVTAGGRKFEMGDELPPGTLNVRAMREIYDTPTRLIETRDYALADPELLSFMLARPSLLPDEDDEDEDRDADGDASTPVVAVQPGKKKSGKNKPR